MVKRTIEISRESVHLAARLDQLVVKREGSDPTTIPFEDIGMVVVDQIRTTYSHAALAGLMRSGSAVVVCGEKHLPVGLLIPLSEHSQVVWRVQAQIDSPLPLRKRLWKQLIQAKIVAQAGNLEPGSSSRRKLIVLSKSVRSGDPENLEAQAARIYWSAWLPSNAEGALSRETDFRRDPDGDGVNSLLNYGYAILRAALARALVSGGLYPALGLHHAHRGNPFCLADDLIEPLRPIVDRRVRRLVLDGRQEIDSHAKAELLELMTAEVAGAGESGPLMVALHKYVASLVWCYEGVSRKLEIPVPCESASIDECGS